MPYTISIHYLELVIFAILTYYVKWVGSFLKNFLKERGGYRNSEVILDSWFVIIYVAFVITKLHPDTIFFQHFLT